MNSNDGDQKPRATKKPTQHSRKSQPAASAPLASSDSVASTQRSRKNPPAASANLASSDSLSTAEGRHLGDGMGASSTRPPKSTGTTSRAVNQNPTTKKKPPEPPRKKPPVASAGLGSSDSDSINTRELEEIVANSKRPSKTTGKKSTAVAKNSQAQTKRTDGTRKSPRITKRSTSVVRSRHSQEQTKKRARPSTSVSSKGSSKGNKAPKTS